MPGILEGKKILVTGVLTPASIAFAIAQAAQKEGADIVLTSFGRVMSLTEKSARRMKPTPEILEMDVNNQEQIDALAQTLKQRWGRLDGFVRGRIGNRVDEPVEPAPALLERLGKSVDLFLVVDVHLQDLGGRFHPAGALLGQAHDAPEAGQDDVGALFLCRLGNREGDAGWGEDAGNQDLLPLEDARHGGPTLSEPALVARMGGLRDLNPRPSDPQSDALT